MGGTSEEEISQWFDEAVAMGATHMLVACDRFDYEDYPVFVGPIGGNELFGFNDVREAVTEYTNPHKMSSVHEVYSMFHSKEAQLAERRAWHLDFPNDASPIGTTVLSCGCGIPWNPVHGNRRLGYRNSPPVICPEHGLTAVQELR